MNGSEDVCHRDSLSVSRDEKRYHKHAFFYVYTPSNYIFSHSGNYRQLSRVRPQDSIANEHGNHVATQITNFRVLIRSHR
jgi:hypothetical protein